VKVVLATLAAAAVVVAGAAPAGAATNADRKTAALQRQVASLSKQVSTLKKQVKSLTKKATQAQDSANAGIVLTFCAIAVTGDGFQNTWDSISQIPGHPTFGQRQALDDRGTCNALRVPRQTTLVPPTISPFTALLALAGRTGPVPMPGLYAPFVPEWR